MYQAKRNSSIVSSMRFSIITSFCSVIGLLGMLCSTAQAATYYVSPTGTASWSQCTNISTPCAPTTGMQNAVAGDIVYFRGGKYELYYDETKPADYYWYRGILSPANSGSATSPITFASNPGESVVLNCHTSTVLGADDVCRAFDNGDKNYITYDGFTITADDGAKMGGLIITGKNVGTRAIGNTVKNCVLNGGAAIITSTDNREGIRMEETSYTHIQNCKLYNYRQETNWANTAAIKMYFNDYATLENLEIYNSTAGIYMKADIDYTIVRNNYVHDTYSAIYGQVYLDRNSDYNQVYNNLVVNNSYIGIGVSQNETATTNGWEVYNNTVYNSHYGIIAAIGDWKVYNNILVNNSSYAIWTYDGNHLVESDHNVFGTAFNIVIRIYSSTQATYNSLSAWQNSNELKDGTNPGVGSLAVAPDFVNSSGSLSKAEDFVLNANSQLRSAGRAGTSMGANINGVGYLSNLVLPKAPTLH